VHGLVLAFKYEDRMKDLPVQDEQGTRERPHFLRMIFDRAGIDAVLKELRIAKWAGDRPRLAVWLAVRDARRRCVLSLDGEHGYGQRELLKSAARRRGMPIALSKEDGSVAYADVTADNPDRLVAATKALGADGMLYGTLTIDLEGFYWNIRWSLDCQGQKASWRQSGVSFDTAIRGGIDRAMGILSGATSSHR
ncbi:MAG: DUF2066 domain-containing protein, partial [Methyloligellaceae bacterium]